MSFDIDALFEGYFLTASIISSKIKIFRKTENLKKFFKYNAQQKKAKAFAFDRLDEVNYFWLKDYCQKILRMKVCERQTDYFGKKGMILHVECEYYLRYGEHNTAKEHLLRKYANCRSRCKRCRATSRQYSEKTSS